MNINTTKSLLSVMLMLAFPTSFVMAQYKVAVDSPEIVEVKSPDLGGGLAKKSYKPKDWMEIEVKFKIEVVDKKKEKFLDKVVVKWYVAALKPGSSGGKSYILLEKEITHVNVPAGEDIYASVYLSPNSIKRLTGSDNISKSDIKNAGGEIMINGQKPVKGSGLFTMDGSIKPDMWWNSGSLSRYDGISLLNKNETPFKMFWYDRYAEIQEKR